MKKQTVNLLLISLGIILITSGIFLVKTYHELKGIMIALPYVFIGVGCGIFGHGMGEAIRLKAISHNPDIIKQIDIEQNDERNITISNRAKAKAYDLMIFVFGVLMLSFVLMGVDIIPILLLVFAYLLVVGYGIYYRIRFDKEM